MYCEYFWSFPQRKRKQRRIQSIIWTEPTKTHLAFLANWKELTKNLSVTFSLSVMLFTVVLEWTCLCLCLTRSLYHKSFFSQWTLIHLFNSPGEEEYREDGITYREERSRFPAHLYIFVDYFYSVASHFYDLSLSESW